MLKINFSLDSNYFRYALRLAVSCSLVVILYEILRLQNGYWAAFSVITCAWPTLGQSLQRAKQRIIGTFIGMWVGILLAHSVGTHVVVIDILLPVCVFFAFYLRAYTYSLFVLFITVIIVLFICLLVPGDWQVAVTRLIMTAFGTAVALIATLFILPSRVSKILPQQMCSARQSVQQYYATICENYLSPQRSSLQATQSQTFKNLQDALTVIQESNLEHWRLTDQDQQHALVYQKLAAIYETLLFLEVHIPAQNQEKSLQSLLQPLTRILNEIKPLFIVSDAAKIAKLNDQLILLVTEVQQLRIVSLKDFSIQTAASYEHIQLTVFLKTLQQLLADLKALSTDYPG